MKKIIIVAILAIGLNSCTDIEQLESGKLNACKLKHLRIYLEQNPSNKAIQDSVKLYEMFVKINRELFASYRMGSEQEFNEKVDKYLKKCN